MKNTIVTIIVLAIIAVLFYFGYQKMINKEVPVTQVVQQENVVKEFGKFSDFVKSDLTEEQKNQLKNILVNRDSKVLEMTEILSKEFKKDDAERKMEEAYAKISEIREEIKSEIMPFIDSTKIDEFNSFFESLGSEIESEFILK